MSLPSYIVNWEELLKGLGDKINVIIDGEMDLDLEPIQNLLEKYFPDIIELLKAIADNTKKLTGVQRINGYHKQVISNQAYEIIYEPTEDVLITGITYAQSIYKCHDSFDLVAINHEGKEVKLFDNIYVKDGMQHKLFQVFFPLPIGYKLKLIMHNQSSVTKDIWVDFEYLGMEAIPSSEGTIIIRYLAKGSNDYVLLEEERQYKNIGVYTISNTKEFKAYKALDPMSKLVTLTTDEPTRMVEFFYESDLKVNHEYDLKVIMRWENSSNVDLDIYGFIDKDINKSVYFASDKYFETEEDKMWLDFDFTSHNVDGYEVQPEIITVKGFKAAILSVQIQNYNQAKLREDVIVEISNQGNEVLEICRVPKEQLNNSKAVYVCDVEIGTSVVTKKGQSIENAGEF